MSREPDRELDDLLAGEPDLQGTARQVREALKGPSADPAYRTRLHNLLVAERARVIDERRREQPRRRRRQRPWWQAAVLGPGVGWRLAPALAVVLVVVLAVTVAPRLLGLGTASVTMSSPVSGQNRANPSAPIVVSFSRPMNHASVDAAVQVSPATAYRTTWKGDDLVITPRNGLAPGVAYEVTVAADRARTSTGAAPARSLHFWFGTGPGVAAAPDANPLAQTAQAFAAAQVAHNEATLRSLSASQVTLPSVPSLDRAWVVWVDSTSDTSAVAEVQLLVDGWPGNPRSQVATETLHLGLNPSTGSPEVQSLTLGGWGNLALGPHIVHIGTSGHTLQVTYNCDMDPASVAGSNRVIGPDGQTVPVTTSYDAATRTVTVQLPASASGRIELTVSRGLRDIHGQHLAAPFRTTLTIS